MTSKTKKRILYTFGSLVAIVLIFIIALSLKFQALSEYALHRAGFPDATIERADLSTTGTTFENIKLQKDGWQIEIAKLSLFATWDDLQATRLGSVEIDGVHAILLPTEKDETQASGLPALALPKPFTLPVRIVDLQNVRVFLPSPMGDLKLELAGNLVDQGDHYQAALEMKGDTAENFAFNGKMTLKAEKTTGIASLHLDIDQGRLAMATPDIDVKRLIGWVSAEIKPDQPLPLIKAQVSAGSIKTYGIPLQGVNLTADITAEKSAVVLQGQALNDSGDILAEVTLDRTDPVQDKLQITLDTKLKNLDAFDTAGLQGRASVALSVSGEKKHAADWMAWENLGGTAAVSASKLSLPGLLKQAEAQAKMDVTYNPDQLTLGALFSDAASFKGIVLPLDAQKPVSLNLPAGKDRAGLAYDTRNKVLGVRFKNMDVTAPLFSAQQAQANVQLSFGSAGLSGVTGSLETGDITHSAKPAAIIPLRLKNTFTAPKGQTGVIGFDGEITEKNGAFYATLKGQHDLRKNVGQLDFNMPPMSFQPRITALKDIIPLSANYAQDVFGTIGTSAQLSWRKNKSTWETGSKAALFLKDVTGTVKNNTVAGINAVLNIDSLLPLAFTEEKLAIGAMNVGLPLNNGVIVASLDTQKKFTLHQAEWTLAGGTLVSTPFSFSLNDMNGQATLTARDLQLAQLFTIAPLDGLTAQGTVQGTLPLEVHNGVVSIKNGVLESMGSGKISYAPQDIPSFLRANGQQQVVDLQVALKAFEFESLKLTIDGTLGKDQKIGLSAKGKNPEFYSGYPVNINLNVEGPLENILKYSPGGRQIPDNIQKQLEEYEQKHDKK